MSTLGTPRSQSRAACALMLIAVFFAGAGAGTIAYSWGSRKWSQKPAPFWTEAGKERSLQKWKNELALTPEQAREIELVLDDFTMYYKSVLSDGKTRILKILSDEQRKKFEKLMIDAQR